MINKTRYKLDTGKMLGLRLIAPEINVDCKSSSQYGVKISVKVGQKLPPVAV